MQGQVREVDRTAIATGLLAALAAAGCGGPDAPERARNAIVLIGDGFGMNHLTLGMTYSEEIEGRPLRMVELADAGAVGYAVPLAYDRIVTDSAAAATQIATGRRALAGTLSVAPETGEPIPTILEWAEERGLVSGLVSNMALTHATPAAFKVHAGSRYAPQGELANQLFDPPEVEVLLGGGGRAMVAAGSRLGERLPGLPEGTDGPSNRDDDRDLLAEAEARGYTLVANRTELAAARGAERLVGVFAANHLPYVLDRSWEGLDEAVPTLAELTEAALASLEPQGEGFFLVVEGGRIDYAGHDNDAGAMLAEILDFDAAVGTAFDFARNRGDTLVLVTADHGTGGFSFTYAPDGPGPLSEAVGWDYRAGPEMAGRRHLELLGGQRRSLIETMADVERPTSGSALIPLMAEATGIRLTEEEAADLAGQLNQEQPQPRDFARFYMEAESIPAALAARQLANHTQVVWSTGGHTSEPAPLFGFGPGAEGVLGIGVTTRIHDILRAALEGSPAGS